MLAKLNAGIGAGKNGASLSAVMESVALAEDELNGDETPPVVACDTVATVVPCASRPPVARSQLPSQPTKVSAALPGVSGGKLNRMRSLLLNSNALVGETAGKLVHGLPATFN